MTMNRTAEPRRILLAVTGLTPQVVTETLYALACAPRERAWIPHEVHLITTTTGAENARLNLLRGDGWFHRLCKDYALPPMAFSVDNIHVLSNAQGEPFEDIRSQEQNTLAADFITDTVRRLTEDEHTELHVSIAGGRKTMGYYLGYAMSLYGRPQDRLSHVLVSDPYETNREFYYPTPYDHPIHSRRGDKEITVDARNARVELASIPFVRLRDELPKRLLSGAVSFSEAVSSANRSLEAPFMRLDCERQEAWVDGLKLPVTRTEFMVLLLFARQAQNDAGPLPLASPEVAEQFVALVRKTLGSYSPEFERIEKALKDRMRGDAPTVSEYFEPHKSRINKLLADLLGKQAAQRYAIKRVRQRETGFFLPLEPAQIDTGGA